MTKAQLDITIGKNIQKERLARDLSVDELAELLGYTPSAVILVESGKRGTSALTLYKLSKIFGLPVDYFLGIEGGIN